MVSGTFVISNKLNYIFQYFFKNLFKHFQLQTTYLQYKNLQYLFTMCGTYATKQSDALLTKIVLTYNEILTLLAILY